jgi:DNA-directed RNA polymerase subunit RPC12/RpoP
MKEMEYKCPVCNGSDLTLRHEASYVYSYKIDSDKPGLMNSVEFLSYQYDKRENTNSREYIECNQCGTQFPCNMLHEIQKED